MENLEAAAVDCVTMNSKPSAIHCRGLFKPLKKQELSGDCSEWVITLLPYNY
jgi:hypothetical protein